MNFLYILGSVFFTILGQLLLKKGAVTLTGHHLWAYAVNPYILGGLFSGGFGALFWIKALQCYDLSYAYPFTSLTFICVVVCSGLIFGETIKWNQWLGVTVVMAGIFIGSR